MSETDVGETDVGETDVGETDVGETGAGEVATGTTGADPLSHRVFVTSETFVGAAVSFADDHCAAAAANAGLGGDWVAWVSTTELDAIDRLTPDAGPYLRLDGLQVAADNADLTDGALDAAIGIDETGTPLESEFEVWAGTLATGTVDVHTCLDWATGTAAQHGGLGFATQTNGLWTATYWGECDTLARLYCFEL